jgi:hypothetical protein
MGWIHDRHMRSGGSIGGRKGPHKGPLRKVVERTYFGTGMFDYDSGVLECGHTNTRITIGAERARCRECGKSELLKEWHISDAFRKEEEELENETDSQAGPPQPKIEFLQLSDFPRKFREIAKSLASVKDCYHAEAVESLALMLEQCQLRRTPNAQRDKTAMTDSLASQARKLADIFAQRMADELGLANEHYDAVWTSAAEEFIREGMREALLSTANEWEDGGSLACMLLDAKGFSAEFSLNEAGLMYGRLDCEGAKALANAAISRLRTEAESLKSSLSALPAKERG